MTRASVEPFEDVESGQAPVRGFIHRVETKGADFLVLTHGAGGNCNAPLLVVLGDAFAAVGLTTLRCDLPFRQRTSDRPSVSFRC